MKKFFQMVGFVPPDPWYVRVYEEHGTAIVMSIATAVITGLAVANFKDRNPNESALENAWQAGLREGTKTLQLQEPASA